MLKVSKLREVYYYYKDNNKKEFTSFTYLAYSSIYIAKATDSFNIG